MARQQRFFDRFLKGVSSEVPEAAVEVTVRTAGGTAKQQLSAGKLGGAHDVSGYRDRALINAVPVTASSASYTGDYSATTAPVRFETAALPEDLEIVGPALLRLFVSSSVTGTSRSTPYRTWHTFDRNEPMAPGTLYAVYVNIWPIARRFAKGNRLTIEIDRREQKGIVTFAHPATVPFVSGGVSMSNGVALAGIVSVHTGSTTASRITLPVNFQG